MQKNQKVGQYEILKAYGKDMAVVRDTMFETTDIYIMTISAQLHLLNIKDYDLTGFPSLINQFQWEDKACFIYKEFEGAHLDTIPYDIEFSVNVIRNLCLSIHHAWELSDGCFCPEINMDKLYFTKDGNFVFKNAYNFSAYKKCSEVSITKQLSYILYQLVTGRKQLDDIRSIDPSFSYILNSTILKCAKEETVLGLEAFATTLQQYKETDLMVYQQDRSLRPSRKKKNVLTRFMPDPEQLEFHKVKPDVIPDVIFENEKTSTKIQSKSVISEEHQQDLETKDSRQSIKKGESIEKHKARQEEKMLLLRKEKDIMLVKTEKMSDEDPSEKNKKIDVQEKASTEIVSKQQKEEIDESNLKIEKSAKQQISSDDKKENMNNKKEEVKAKPKKPKSKVESYLSQKEKIEKEKGQEKETIPQVKFKEKNQKEIQQKSHIPKPRFQKPIVQNKQEEKRIRNISSGKGPWNNIKLPKVYDEKSEKKEKEILNDKVSLNLELKKEKDYKNKNDFNKKEQYLEKEIVEHKASMDHQKLYHQKTSDIKLEHEDDMIQDSEISKEPDHNETTSDISSAVIVGEIEEVKKSNTVSAGEIILENKMEVPMESFSIKDVMQKNENVVYKSTANDRKKQVSLTSSAKEELPIQEKIESKKEDKVKKERKLMVPKVNIPKGVCIAIISFVLLITGITGFFVHNIHQKNKYNDIIEVVDRSTNQKEKIRMLHQAIKILPKESKAYEKLLDVYLEDAVFSSKEESAYLKTIHQNWDKVKKGDGYGNLSYKIGKAYWYYYEYDNMNNEGITRMKSAVRWFEDSLKYKSTAKHHRIAKIYCEIGKFNQEITLNVKEGTDKGVYKKYYNNLKDLLKIGNSNTVASLELYKLTVNSIDIYRQRIIDDGISEEEINQTKQDVLYKVNETSVVTEKEKELKNTILYSSK